MEKQVINILSQQDKNNKLITIQKLKKWKELKISQLKNQIKSNQISSDDLAFSAYLKVQGYPLIKFNHNKSKSKFMFEIGTENAHELKMSFINSDFLSYYNELRNLKKLI